MSTSPRSRASAAVDGRPKKPSTGRALADIQYNAILADQPSSSDDESPNRHAVDEDSAQTAIGVSIGRAQTRLVLPKTPAVEKAAAIEEAGDYFPASLDGSNSPLTETPEQEDDDKEVEPLSNIDNKGSESSTPVPSSPVQPPSPWRAGPKLFEKKRREDEERSDHTRSVLRDSFSFGRKRASSGPDSWHKSLFSSFPSMTSLSKSLGMGSSSVNEGDGENQSQKTSVSNGRSTPNSGPFSTCLDKSTETLTRFTSGSRTPKNVEDEAGAVVVDLPDGEKLQHLRSRPHVLRKSTSDNSLMTQRTLSMVTSLGDDSRFENVSEQVNSRFKAIKDSLQDSKIALPSMPSISSFNVSNFTPDFMNRERSGSASMKQSSPRLGGSSQFAKYDEQPIDPLTRQVYPSAKQALQDVHDKHVDHPHFHTALDHLQGDIVVLGGYRGSILRSAEPPHRQLWVPVKVGLNLRKVDLEVSFGEDGDERATDTVIPSTMLTHIGPVDISRRLLKRMRSCANSRSGKLRVHEYGYDWRLDPAYLSRQLLSFVEKLPCNRPGVSPSQRGATIVAHSLGGLITRHAINQRPELFGAVVYAGVPSTCVNILGPLRNGDEVLLSSRVLTAQVNFSIRTSFALLPLDGRCFIDKNTKEEYPVDFFDPQTWIDCRLSPCVARPLPPLTTPPKPTGISGYINSMANALPSLPRPGRKDSKPFSEGMVAAPETLDAGAQSSDVAMASGNIDNGLGHMDDNADPGSDVSSVRTAVTVPRDEAIAYLTRTLASVKKFKQELAHNETHQSNNLYPPISVIYGKSTPTVIGAKVDGREGIKHADAYDELAFASGDGVVLARAAQAPPGYLLARNGIVSSERGHVTLLGDLEAVGRCLNAVRRARAKGVGLGIVK